MNLLIFFTFYEETKENFKFTYNGYKKNPLMFLFIAKKILYVLDCNQ